MVASPDQWYSYLLAEHRHFHESFWKNEEVGEKRVNFYITFSTAMITALVAISTAGESLIDENRFILLSLFAVAALMMLGYITLLRMVKRNKATDEYKVALDLIRDQYKVEDIERAKYNPFSDSWKKTVKKRCKKRPRKFGTGGLVDMVLMMNMIVSIALGIVLGLAIQLHIASEYDVEVIVSICVIIFLIIVGGLQYSFLKKKGYQWRGKKNVKDPKSPPSTKT